MAVIVVALARITPAQEPSAGAPPLIKVQVQQVLVPAVVTDRKGHFITDLKADDFQVFEDGVEQKVVALSTEANGAAALFPSEAGPLRVSGGSIGLPPLATLSPPASGSPVSRTYLIVLDTLFSSFGDFHQVRQALKKLFKEEEGSGSEYALVAIGRQTIVIQNLTRDPEAVLAAVDSKELTRAILSSEHSNLAHQESDLLDMLERCPPPVMPKSGAEEPCPSAESFANEAARERDRLTRNLIIDLRSLTEQLSRMPGRRAMILASDGFNLQPGRELFELIAAYTRDPSVLMHNKTSYLLDDLNPIVRLATAHNVTFYTLDSRGVYAVPAGGFDASQHVSMDPRVAASVLPEMEGAKDTAALEQQDAMNYLAGATGGVFYHGNNDLLRGFRQAFADGREYYVLAYSSSNGEADGKYRAIRVEVKGKNLIVRAKPGYWAPRTHTASAAAPPRAEASASTPTPPSAPIPSWARNTPPIALTPPVESSILTAPPTPSLVDLSTGELVRELPELKKLEPAETQDILPSILQEVGANVAILFSSFPNVTCREEVTEQRLGVSGALEGQIYQTFRYLAVENGKRNVEFEEYRTDNKGRLVQRKGLDSGYLITEGFVSIPLFFHPSFQPESRFRYLGQEVIGKRPTEVVAFTQRPNARMRELFASDGTSKYVLTQGVAWIDPASDQIVRIRMDLTAPVLDIGLESQTTHIDFTEVHFKGGSLPLWLPREVKVQTKFFGDVFRNTHLYSEYKQFTVQTQEKQVPAFH